MPRTLLVVGDGREHRRAAVRARALGLRVVAEAVDVRDAEAVARVAEHHAVDGVLGVPPIVSRIAVRRRLTEAGVPQPRFAAVRTIHEGHLALETVGVPAVLKPADAGDESAPFLLRSPDDLDAHLHVALARSAAGEAVVESVREGAELDVVCVARAGRVACRATCDRLPAPGAVGVARAHLYPSRLFGDALEQVAGVAAHAVRALAIRDGLACLRLVVDDGKAEVLHVATPLPPPELDALVRVATGLDLVEVALRLALAVEVPDELAAPRYHRPAALVVLAADPGPLPTGRVRSWRGLERVLAAPGVVEAEVLLRPGERLAPLRADADRRGHVLAVAPTNLEALERAWTAARLLAVEVDAA